MFNLNVLYPITLAIHSILRWVVLLLGLFVIIRALTGLRFKRPWERMDDRAGLFFTIAFDTQILIGLLLYFFFSPLTKMLLQGAAGVMKDPVIRYFGIEHVAVMLVAVALVHIGRARSRKAKDKLAQHRNAAIFYTLALVAVLAAIPWPFLANVARPWL